jgi:SAM-dependent methyltransferase
VAGVYNAFFVRQNPEMKLFSFLEKNPTSYEWSQRLVSLNYGCFRRVLREEGFFVPGKSFLDLGCGTGFLRDYLPDEDYLGVDINPTYIAAARRKRGNFFQVGNALEIGALTRRFDRIGCMGLFHHLDDAQCRHALGQCGSILSPGGQIFIFDALWPIGTNPVGTLLRQSDNGAFIRTLPQWEELFGAELDLLVLRAVGQWPLDYVFAKATAKNHLGKIFRGPLI